MATGIKTFCLKYKEKLNNDKDIEEKKLISIEDCRDRISFYVNITSTIPAYLTMDSLQGHNLFRLDNEDLEYLYNKYSKKLDEEMETVIEKLKEDYSKAKL